MGIISWAIWGLFVGAIARLLRPGRQAIGLWLTVALGVVGSVLGGFLATNVLDIADSDEFDIGSFFIAVATSVLLLYIYEQIAKRQASKEEPPQRTV
jgi:uncharacterized membrane protein YeaQ/YmgE (transglycosylase-associated protein family)